MVGALDRAECAHERQPFPSLWRTFEDRYPLKQNDADALEQMHQKLIDASNHYVGFPNSRIFSYSSAARFLKFNINNIGDPYHPNSGMNSAIKRWNLLIFSAKCLSYANQRLEKRPMAVRNQHYLHAGSTEIATFFSDQPITACLKIFLNMPFCQ